MEETAMKFRVWEEDGLFSKETAAIVTREDLDILDVDRDTRQAILSAMRECTEGLFGSGAARVKKGRTVFVVEPA
jgi:hypothetical protein